MYRNMKASPVHLFLFAAFAACTTGSFAQTKENVPFTELFIIRIDTTGGKAFITFGPDSLPGGTALNARCSALYHFQDYLFANFAEVMYEREQLQATLPDTLALRNKFNELLLTDTTFQTLYMRSIDQTAVAPLSMDSALIIASHFFYLHQMHGKPTAHICVGINKVKEISESMAHPYHAAFCFMAVWSMDDPMGLLQKALDPIRDELKGNPSDERMAEMQQAVYDKIARSPELRKAVLDTYEQKAQYLNFKLQQ